MITPCRIELFGGLTVHVSGREITKFQTQKTAALLAYLALHPHRQFSRETIATMLWQVGDSTALRNRLNQAVSSLRRQLHPPGSSKSAVLHADHQVVGLNPDAVTTDVAEFQSQLELAGAFDDHDAEAAAQARHRAINLYKGKLLDGFSEDWAALEAIRLADQYYDALTWLVRYHAGRDEFDLAIEMVTRRLRLDPTNEKSHRTLMWLYLKGGRPLSAIAQYTELQRLLASVGRTPARGTQQIYEQARMLAPEVPKSGLSEATHPKSAPARSRAFRLDSAVANIAQAPLVAGLPRYSARLFGREQDLQNLDQWLSRGETRLCTLRGLAGIGKTRIAVEFGRRIQESGSHRVDYVRMDSSKGDPLEQIAAAVTASDASASHAPDSLSRLLSTSGPTLLILDGIQSNDVDSVIAIQSLLESSDGVHILVTSRQALNLPTELLQNVGPLELPREVTDDVASLIQAPAMAMFVARAQNARPDFQVTPRNADAVRQLVARLDGIPLGIELMASWSRTLSPAQMLERLTSHQDGIQARGISLNTEHSSMHSAIETTFDLLNPDCQKVFLRLATFAGGWNHFGAVSLCPDVDVDAALRDLEEVCLIASNEFGPIMRFTMLDTVRAFALERTSAPERAAWLREHAVYHYQRALEFNQHDNLARFEGLVDESANLRQAVEWFMDNDLEEESLKFCALIGRYGVFVDRPLDVVDMLESALERFDDSNQFPAVRAEAMVRLASVYNRLGNDTRAREIIEKAEAILKGIDAPKVWIELHLALAEVDHANHDFDAECGSLRQALELSLKASSFRADRIYLSMGHVMVERQDRARAAELYQQSIEESKAKNDGYRVALATSSLANLHRLEHNFTLAEELAQTSLDTLSAFPGRFFTADAQLLLAQIYLDENKLDECRAMLLKVIESDPQTEWQREELCLVLARVCSKSEDFELSARYLGFNRVLDQLEARPCIATNDLRSVVRRVESELGSKSFRQHYDVGSFWTWKTVRESAIRLCDSPASVVNSV